MANGYDPDAMREGTMPETSKPGKSVYMEVGVWWDPDQGHIHVTAKNVLGFHTTVSPDASSKRGHPNLFMKLAKVLRDNGAPHPEIKEQTDI
ncbi:hypothetical protein [Bradyrhizobium sp.]|uniref:hypothetical protein n=1 Tax=Bradyrhizobium sp. TaxID=376 RepID=UPI0012E71AC0|nr:hypothetical protein [Bradyrhizobium sp.]